MFQTAIPKGIFFSKIFSNTGIIFLTERKNSNIVFNSVFFNLKCVLLRRVLYVDGISHGFVANT